MLAAIPFYCLPIPWFSSPLLVIFVKKDKDIDAFEHGTVYASGANSDAKADSLAKDDPVHGNPPVAYSCLARTHRQGNA